MRCSPAASEPQLFDGWNSMSGLLRISLCPGCFGNAEWTRTVGLVRTRCPSCGERSWPGLKRLGHLSERAAVNGYLYPLMVERRPSKRHQLAPDAVVTWLALAVLSGVAGNLSYDLLKAALGKITKRRKKLEVVAHGSADVNSGRIVIGPEAQLTVNWSDEELEAFVRRLRAYYKERPGALKAARKALVGSGVLESQRTEAPRSSEAPSPKKRLQPSKARRTASRRSRRKRFRTTGDSR